MERWKISSRKASLSLCVLLIAGCARHPAESPDERLRRQASEDARQVHHDVQAAGVEARRALANAGRETRDIVAGAREGWREGAPAASTKPGVKPHPGAVDINSASAADLAMLPGIGSSTARRIVRGRPYDSPRALVDRGLLTPEQFDRVQRRLAAR